MKVSTITGADVTQILDPTVMPSATSEGNHRCLPYQKSLNILKYNHLLLQFGIIMDLDFKRAVAILTQERHN